MAEETVLKLTWKKIMTKVGKLAINWKENFKRPKSAPQKLGRNFSWKIS